MSDDDDDDGGGDGSALDDFSQLALVLSALKRSPTHHPNRLICVESRCQGLPPLCPWD